ncbi:MAG: hypothetical protein CMJ33_08220 [Phycisphaerae bacterium]|nr:hypothetical protein [Phycisphaerae bacterium]HAW94748.1 hypothetical protein [Phycisphaerales bacterium]
MDWQLLGEFLFLLSSAVAVAAIVERFGVSSIVGYLLGGMLVGPGVLGFVGSANSESSYAVMTELGVSLLLFTIGLEITPGKLKLFGIRGGVIGLAQVLLTTGIGLITILLFTGVSLGTAFAASCMVTMSSTAVVVRVLSDRNELDAPHGRDALSILLLQDFAVVPMLLIVSMLGDSSLDTTIEESGGSILPTTTMLLGMLVLVVLTVFVLPRILGSEIFRRNRDFPVIIALTTALTAAWGSHTIGLSAELGAFVAGIILARTDFARQLRADVQALKAVFLTLFFASVGLLVDVEWLLRDGNWAEVLLFTGVGILGKSIIVSTIVVLSGGRIRQGVRSGLCIAQIGEFSFVIGSIAFTRGLLDYGGFQALVSATVLSLIFTPGLIAVAGRSGIRVEDMLKKVGLLKKRGREDRDETDQLFDHVVIAGFGPSGEEAARMMQLVGIETYVIDLNRALVENARKMGARADLGNSAQREILEHAHLGSARALIVTVPDPHATVATIEQARMIAPDILICARARFKKFNELFEKAGADHVVVEEGVSGTLLGSMAASVLGRSDEDQD